MSRFVLNFGLTLPSRSFEANPPMIDYNIAKTYTTLLLNELCKESVKILKIISFCIVGRPALFRICRAVLFTSSCMEACYCRLIGGTKHGVSCIDGWCLDKTVANLRHLPEPDIINKTIS